MFKGNRILAEKVKGMTINKINHVARQQINVSTFAKDQMPTIAGDNKQWKRVVRPPDVKELKQNKILGQQQSMSGYLVSLQLVVT